MKDKLKRLLAKRKEFGKREYIFTVFCWLIIVFAIYLVIDSTIYAVNIGDIFAIFNLIAGWFSYLITVFIFFFLPFMMCGYLVVDDDEKRKKQKKSKYANSKYYAEKYPRVYKDGLVAIAKHSKKHKIILIILLIVMFCASAVCISVYSVNKIEKSKYVETEAICIGYMGSINGTAIRQFKFTDSNGIEYTCTPTARGDINTVTIGEKITIYYNPLNPAEIYDGEGYGFYLGLGLFFFFCFLITIFAYFVGDGIIQTHLFIASVCIGLTMIAAVFIASDYNAKNFFEIVRKLPAFQFVLFFGYMGAVSLFIVITNIIERLIKRN